MSHPSLFGPPPYPGPSLSVVVDPAAGRLTVSGELDRRTTYRFLDAVSALAVTDRPVWLLDVSGLAVRDADGLRAIGWAYRRALRSGRRLVLVGAPPLLRRALVRLRLEQHVLAPSKPPTGELPAQRVAQPA